MPFATTSTPAAASSLMRLVPRAGAIAALLTLGVAAPLALAQEDMAMAGHPAHFHSGTCAELGDVVIPLTDLASPEAMMGGEMAGDEMGTPDESMGDMGGGMMGAAETVPVVMSSTVVDVPFEEIVNGEHAINIHESADAIDVYIACGNVGGMVTMDEDGSQELIVGLAELNDSGYNGVAWLGANGDQTEVSVVLVSGDPMMGMDH